VIGEWLHDAACRDATEEFVDITEQQADELIVAFCTRCPVQVPCGLLGAEQTNRVGAVWGGRFVHNKRST